MIDNNVSDGHSSEIKIYEKIFNDINNTKFQGKLPLARIRLCGAGKDGAFICDRVIKVKSDFQYGIDLDEFECLGDIQRATECIFHNMVHLYCYLNDIKDTSNKYVYHNKRFAKAARAHGGIVEKYEYGYRIIGLDDELCELIKKHKTDSLNRIRYVADTPKCENHHKKYVDKRTGNSVRATKTHILLCLDGLPEIASKIQHDYHIEPMILEV